MVCESGNLCLRLLGGGETVERADAVRPLKLISLRFCSLPPRYGVLNISFEEEAAKDDVASV